MGSTSFHAAKRFREALLLEEIAKRPYDGRGRHSPQWWPLRHGSDDQAGACNELTAERTLATLSLPRSGHVIELGQLLEAGVPIFPPRIFNQLILAHAVLESLPVAPGENDVNWFEEQVVQPYQVCCHVDGLGHVDVRSHFYNGNKTRELIEGGHYEFLFLLAPLKARDVTAGLAAPVAVV